MSPHIRTQFGFTLMETVVAIAIFSALMLGVTLMVKDVFVNSRNQISALGSVDQARLVSGRFVNEIRNATYGIDGSYPLNTAGDSQIIFYSNYAGDSTTVYRFRYYLSGSTLYRGVTTPTGSPMAYNTAQEVITPVQTNVQNGSTPVFYYYNGAYAGSGSALAQPINVNDPKYMQINLIILSQDVRGSNATYTVKIGALMRNLKTNLGD